MEGELSGLGKNIEFLKNRHQEGLNQKSAFANLKKKNIKPKNEELY